MILFDLKCPCGHVFECWFASSEAYADQKRAGLIPCPACGATDVEKAVMAPRLSFGAQGGAAERSDVAPPSSSPTPPEEISGGAGPESGEGDVRRAFAALARLQQRMLAKSLWVGDRFAAEARAQAEGEADAAPIHGTAAPEQVKALREDGIAVMPLLVPFVPPEHRN